MVNKTDTQIPQLIINKLTKEQYEQALAQGLISETELYAVTDEDDYVTVNTFNNIIAQKNGVGQFFGMFVNKIDV